MKQSGTKNEVQVNKVTLFSLIPGFGQLANGQKAKGIAFFSIFLIFVIQMILGGFQSLVGLVTLGSIPIEDHSLFILIEGTLQLIITIIFFLFYGLNLYDARRVATMRKNGQKINVTMKETLQTIGDEGFPYLLTLPAYLLMIFTIIFPVLVTLFTAFTNYDFNHIPPASLIDWVGFKNFFSIFFLSSYRNTFLSVFSWTIIWTLCATTLQISLGVLTAVVAHQKFIKFKRVFGIIFLLPWAVPAFITIMSFSNIFNDSVGAINTQVIPFLNNLPLVDIGAISWKTDPNWTKVAIILVQGWLGFPYIYVMVTGILQSISEDLYEAAKIDGANAWKRFSNITLPAIFLVAAPTFITQYTGNFNNFSMIYLFNNGGPGSVGGGAGSTDILISWIYKLTTGTSPQYSMASAITLIISAVVICVSLLVFKKTNAFNMGD
ncbi:MULTISPECIES: carbohydrate ABC transporter permease [Enterococcus]|uniref:Maltose/maltodextrin transport system permease protein n=1 Tax=Enterococcus thailandicus TaxID=417368 RepID=A0A179ETD0_ENTTH|nr:MULTISPECIES: sugar ABC transporter permease [Enterococcus]ASZ07626.1 sugar ABC transporter permease [Enterococcus thailandicus]MDA3965561.1 sugar ABC transporter permease [Enterococcus thailandicus]MDK4351030.1 sugar ABC transporter permease [Enterococcus thailandicus]MDT2733318.1 sugar ABC transporter permease [Enterococcus thailandicus]MDT2750684.1 sugar ABC transporter permease [Enterococcus thailandicus]